MGPHLPVLKPSNAVSHFPELLCEGQLNLKTLGVHNFASVHDFMNISYLVNAV
jgi:hypothetical protein